MSIVAELNHGLGNKLFKLIHSLIAGEQYNRKVLIYSHDSKHEVNDKYEISKFFPKVKNLITEISENDYNDYKKNNNYLTDEEICFAKINSDIIILDGYMMIKYYLLNNIWRKWILNIFKPISLKNNLIDKPSIGVHIRVGDYLKYEGKNKMYPIYTQEYYIDIIKRYPNHTVYFFTDTGQNFIKKYIIPKISNQYKFINNSALEDLITLSMCDILILSASTFSYWSGYLSSGVIYCPKYWLMIKLRLENWTIIDTDNYIAKDYEIYK
jgi:hypothetical protein